MAAQELGYSFSGITSRGGFQELEELSARAGWEVLGRVRDDVGVCSAAVDRREVEPDGDAAGVAVGVGVGDLGGAGGGGEAHGDGGGGGGEVWGGGEGGGG